MNTKRLLIVVLLGLSLPAAAEFTTVAPAYEVRLSNFQAPASQNGGIAFKPCDDCEQMRLRVNPSTQYWVNGKSVRLGDFRQALMQVRDRSKPTVVVKHHLETDAVVSIKITIRD